MLDHFIDKKLKSIITEEHIRVNEPMWKHTTFRVGGSATYFISVTKEKEIALLLRLLREEKYPHFILGNGSNLLVADQGYQGVIIFIGDEFSNIIIEGTKVTVEAGAYMSKVAKVAMEAGLSGFEFASGIPGTMGGGVAMNAGAYGGEMEQVVESIHAIDDKGNLVIIEKEKMEFDYRKSIVKEKNLVVTKVVLSLKQSHRDEVYERISELAVMRKEKQPIEFPSAGSTFKRPPGEFAGKLIMEAGLKGFQIGGAKISEKHAGFLVNAGGATASEIVSVMEETKKRVWEHSGIMLEPEVILLGEF